MANPIKNYLALGLLAAALAGCVDKETAKPEYRGTTRTVPVMSIQVQKGDSMEKILREEFRDADTWKFGRLSRSTPYNFLMLGDRYSGDVPSNWRSHANIIYEFDLVPIIEQLNPKRFDREPVSNARLKAGEHLVLPDFSNDDTIGGRQGEKVGYLKLEGKRSLDGLDRVEKNFYFKPSKK